MLIIISKWHTSLAAHFELNFHCHQYTSQPLSTGFQDIIQSRNPKSSLQGSGQWMEMSEECKWLWSAAEWSQTKGSNHHSVLGLWPNFHFFFFFSKKNKRAEILCEIPWFLNISNSFKFKTHLQAVLQCKTSGKDSVLNQNKYN